MSRIIMSICMMVLALIVYGCQDTAETISERQARLVASQNIELKEQLAQKDEEIQTLESELDECQGRVESMKQQSMAAAGNMMDMIKSATENITEQNIELQERVKELEAQLAEQSTE